MPETSLKVMTIFNYKESDIKLNTIKDNNFIKKGIKLSKIGILFKKVEK